ncbi:UNVERIFIED_CONTAM: hypothetical protein Sindi_0224700 [Sesamum indicum]
MKRKRGAGKRKSKKPSTGGSGEVFVEPGYYSDRNEENDELVSRTEIGTRAVHTKLSGLHAVLDNQTTNNETVSGAVAKLARAISSSHVNPINDIVSQQRERVGQKEPKSSHQEPVYNKQELDAAHKLRFDIDPTSKNWVLQSLGRRWKDWKSKLKTAHYYPHQTDEARLADCDERILPDQWAALVKLWSTESAQFSYEFLYLRLVNVIIKFITPQKNSATNRANRMKAKYIHASGRKSFARIREEQRNRPDGKELSRAELFILTRTRKDGKPVNEASSEVIKKLQYRVNGQDTPQDSNKQGDVLSQIIGSDKRGRTRCIELGIELGPSYPPDLGSPKPACSESTRMVSESDANAEIRDLKEKMAVMEKTCTQMVSQMAALVSMVSSMHKNTPDRNVPDMVGSLKEQVANTSSASDHPAAQAVDTRPTTRGASMRQVSTIFPLIECLLDAPGP